MPSRLAAGDGETFLADVDLEVDRFLELTFGGVSSSRLLRCALPLRLRRFEEVSSLSAGFRVREEDTRRSSCGLASLSPSERSFSTLRPLSGAYVLAFSFSASRVLDGDLDAPIFLRERDPFSGRDVNSEMEVRNFERDWRGDNDSASAKRLLRGESEAGDD